MQLRIVDFGLRIADWKKRDENGKTSRPLCVAMGPAEKQASVSSFLPVKSSQFQSKVLSFLFVEWLQVPRRFCCLDL